MTEKEKLLENGFSEKSATAIAEAMVARANGQELSLKQERLLNAYKDDVRVQNAEKTIIKNDKSTMGQRNQKVAQLGHNIAFEAAVPLPPPGAAAYLLGAVSCLRPYEF